MDLGNHDVGIINLLPSGKSVFGCRCIFVIKVGPDGIIDCLKTRIVAKVMRIK